MPSSTTPPPPPLPSDDRRPDWPGQDLGLPQSGPRSVGRLGRRLLALLIDWGLASLLSAILFRYSGIATIAIFAAMQMIFLMTLGGSLGHIVCRMRLVPIPAGYIGIWRPIVRTLLVCIVIPAVIYDRDQRGLHDRACGTVLVRV